MALSKADPRFSPYSAVIDEQLWVWAGKNECSKSVLVYHPCSESWRKLRTSGFKPVGLYGGASAYSGHHFYTYGGARFKGLLTGCLHKLDIISCQWAQVASSSVGAPMKKIGCGMLVYEGQLYLFGGLGAVNGSIQLGSEWQKQNDGDGDNNPKTKGYTNEMHKYDFKHSEYW